MEFTQGEKPTDEGHYWFYGLLYGFSIARVYWGSMKDELGVRRPDLRCDYEAGGDCYNVRLEEMASFWKFYHPAIPRPADAGPMGQDGFIEREMTT